MTIKAPISAFVFDTFYTQGEWVPINTPVLSLLSPNNTKIIFYVPEYWLSKLKLKQAIEMSCDGCKETVKGTILYISPHAEFTPPIIYSADERVKLVYRVEASPLNAESSLHPGQPVNVSAEIE